MAFQRHSTSHQAPWQGNSSRWRRGAHPVGGNFNLDAPAHTLDNSGVRVCVIFNPAARGEKADRLRRHLELNAATARLRPTGAPGDARQLAAEAVRDGFEVIVAAGGDGTVNEVVNGIGDVPDGLARTRLGVLPLGTVNVFAIELGLPASMDRAWDIIRDGRPTRIDLPQVELQGANGPERRYFAELAGAGLDARAVEIVSWPLKKRVGLLAYVLALFRALGERQPRLTVTAGAETAAGQLVLVGNGRYYGGRFPVFGDGDLRDGHLGVFVLPRANWLAVARCAAAWLGGRLDRFSGARHLRAVSFHLAGADPARLELDGEPAGGLPATFSLQSRGLQVMVPSG